jgi:hypothetical protein
MIWLKQKIFVTVFKRNNMGTNLLFWTYLINAVILIIHEIDSAYWQEWKLINPDEKNGINGFLILHIPMIFFVLIGLVLVHEQAFAGLIISLILSASLLFPLLLPPKRQA